MRLSTRITRSGMVALLLSSVGCGNAGSEKSSEPSSKSKADRKKAASTASATASASSSASAPRDEPEGSIDATAFCARAAKLSQANVGKCTTAEQQNLSAPELDAVKSLSILEKECTIRVTSTKATYDPKAGQHCIEAAEKHGGLMTFYRFSEIPECRGVVVGTAGEGQPVLYAEECGPGLAWVTNRCAKPGAKNARCARGTAGILGNPTQHTACQDGLACLYTRYPYEGDTGELHCLEPTPMGGACRMRGADPRLTNLCPDGSTCYQGKCRTLSAEGGDCMSWEDCGSRLRCEIKGGAFGKCVAMGPEKCLADMKP